MKSDSSMVSVLHLNLHREFFLQIAEGTKRTEYRSQTPYWRGRLENRHESTRAYIDFMRPRCVELARILKKAGRFSLPLRN